MVKRCNICGNQENDVLLVSHLHPFGSEGVDACLDCRKILCDMIWAMRFVANKQKIIPGNQRLKDFLEQQILDVTQKLCRPDMPGEIKRNWRARKEILEMVLEKLQ